MHRFWKPRDLRVKLNRLGPKRDSVIIPSSKIATLFSTSPPTCTSAPIFISTSKTPRPPSELANRRYLHFPSTACFSNMSEVLNANPTIRNASDLPSRRRQASPHSSSKTSLGLFASTVPASAYAPDPFTPLTSSESENSDDDDTVEPIDEQEIYGRSPLSLHFGAVLGRLDDTDWASCTSDSIMVESGNTLPGELHGLGLRRPDSHGHAITTLS